MNIKPIMKSSLAGLALIAMPAAAQTADGDYMMPSEEAKAQMAQGNFMMPWEEATNNTASAERMMSGDVTNGFNMLGNVKDLILNTAGTQIQYVLYEVPSPWSFYGGEDGFVAWDNIAVERGVGAGLDLRLDDGESPYAKEQLELTRNQANNRMVSRIVGEDLMFADGAMREIDDILFNPKTGMVTHYLVEMDADSLFREDIRRIPASYVSWDSQGMMRVSQPTTYQYEVWMF